MPRPKKPERTKHSRRQGKAKRRRQESPNTELVQEGLCTPPHGVAEVNVDNVSVKTKFLDAQSEVVTTPKSRGRSLLRRRRILFSYEQRSTFDSAITPPWSTSELLGLVIYLVEHGHASTWPRQMSRNFWDEAGKFVQSQVKSAYCRSGMCAYL